MKIAKIFALMALALTFTGCRHKDFCYFHPHGDIHVNVEYDDNRDPDDIVYLRDKVRATRLIAYSHPESSMILASDITRTVNELPLGANTYHFIAYNAGTSTISFDYRDLFHAHEATTRECDILEPLYGSRAVESDIDLGNGEPVVIAAEPLWAIGAEATECALGDTIRMTALPLHCRYTYEMRNIEDLGQVVRISSFITGMSRGANLKNNELHDTPVTVAVPAEVAPDGKTVVGSFICFGQNPAIGGIRHRMGLFIETDTGRKFKILEGDHFDVTDQVVNAPNRRRVHIIIDGVKIPPPEVNSGFEVEVRPWGDGENIDILYPL